MKTWHKGQLLGVCQPEHLPICLNVAGVLRGALLIQITTTLGLKVKRFS